MPETTVAVREQIIALAQSQLGVNESPPNSNRTPYTAWYGMVGPWCAMFVSWVLYHAGFPLPITTALGFAYCPYGVAWFKNNGAWASKNTKPERGWIVFFDFIGRPSHVGIVEGITPDGRIITLEGNTNGAGSRTGGAVMRHYRNVSSGIIGYGIINYTGADSLPVPPANGAPRNLGRGMQGDDVKDLQTILIGAGYAIAADGDFGPATEHALKQFQAKLGLEADGIAGPQTRQKIAEVLAYVAAVNAAPVAPPVPASRGTIRAGSRGDDVTYAQQRLGIRADGIFGPNTERSVKTFQRRNGLTADGIVGPRTWAKLG